MKIKKTHSKDNVIFVDRPRGFWERMSYTELLLERKVMRDYKARTQKCIKQTWKIDPRGMITPDLQKIVDEFEEIIKSCNWFIETFEKEMIKRN